MKSSFWYEVGVGIEDKFYEELNLIALSISKGVSERIDDRYVEVLIDYPIDDDFLERELVYVATCTIYIVADEKFHRLPEYVYGFTIPAYSNVIEKFLSGGLVDRLIEEIVDDYNSGKSELDVVTYDELSELVDLENLEI